MAKNPTKRVAEKGKPMEMRMLKAPFGVRTHEYAFQRATTPLPVVQEAPKHKLLESSYEELARAMQELKLRVNHVENTLARIKAAMSPPSP